MSDQHNIIIRDAVEADIEEITLLMEHLSYPTTLADMRTRMGKIMKHPDYRTILAILDGEIVGMAGLCKGLYYEKNGDYVRILAFVTRRGFRGKGIGKVLMQACEDWAREVGVHTVIVNSGNREDRKDAHQFYQRVGYTLKSSGFVKEV